MMDRLKGKRILVTGDSITDKSHGYVNTNYVDYLEDVLGVTCINDGKSGTGIWQPADGNMGIYHRIDTWDATYGNFDGVILMGNMNDFAIWATGAFNVGNFGDQLTHGVVTQYSLVQAVIEKITTRYINKPFLWIMSTPRNSSWPGFAVQKLWGVDSVWNAYGDAIKHVCAHYSVPVLDLYHHSGLRPWLVTDAFTPEDVVHPTDAGHAIIAPKICSFVLDNF